MRGRQGRRLRPRRRRRRARAALAGGATWLAVATAHEARELRAAGIADAPVLVLARSRPASCDVALAARADVVAWREELVAARRRRAAARRVHVKLDTGMGRLGHARPRAGAARRGRSRGRAGLELVGAMTHFATADEPGDAFFGEQLARFSAVGGGHARARTPAWSSTPPTARRRCATPPRHFDLVRSGVAIYGLDPFGEDPRAPRPASPRWRCRSWVAAVKPIAPGESAGYGRRFVAERPTYVATVPIGYGDGLRRAPSPTTPRCWSAGGACRSSAR